MVFSSLCDGLRGPLMLLTALFTVVSEVDNNASEAAAFAVVAARAGCIDEDALTVALGIRRGAAAALTSSLTLSSAVAN